LKAKAKADQISRFEERSKAVKDFMQLVKPSLLLDMVELQDPYGPTITDPNVDALMVSSETTAGAFKINDIRKSKGMTALALLVSRRADAATLSSSFIRDYDARNKPSNL